MSTRALLQSKCEGGSLFSSVFDAVSGNHTRTRCRSSQAELKQGDLLAPNTYVYLHCSLSIAREKGFNTEWSGIRKKQNKTKNEKQKQLPVIVSSLWADASSWVLNWIRIKEETQPAPESDVSVPSYDHVNKKTEKEEHTHIKIKKSIQKFVFNWP